MKALTDQACQVVPVAAADVDAGHFPAVFSQRAKKLEKWKTIVIN
jgi:hypothetical protein